MNTAGTRLLRVSCLFSVASLFTSVPGSLGGTKVSTERLAKSTPPAVAPLGGARPLEGGTPEILPSMPLAGLGGLASTLHPVSKASTSSPAGCLSLASHPCFAIVLEQPDQSQAV